jgi:hypothetical protein
VRTVSLPEMALCDCGEPKKMGVCKTGENEGKRYEACPQEKGQQCPNHFRWLKPGEKIREKYGGTDWNSNGGLFKRKPVPQKESPSKKQKTNEPLTDSDAKLLLNLMGDKMKFEQLCKRVAEMQSKLDYIYRTVRRQDTNAEAISADEHGFPE